ncbi:MAG: cytochrome c [Gammaproteobacteria bacterium]|nr:cytochrome c [Gammaproteobacteria bacterium]MBI5619063.1 cytochrome c [Gammaproteobacteria bacterium]
MRKVRAAVRFACLAGLLSPTATPAADIGHALLAPDSSHDLHDAREPVRMPAHMAARQKANMRHHLDIVSTVVAALGREDYPAIAAAASDMGTTPETTAMCRHMGAGGPADFTTRALAFHASADRLAAASGTQDRSKVLAALGETLQACTECHARFRQEIVAPQP